MLDSGRWRDIERIFHAAVACEGDQRAERVRRACAGDEALRQEIDSLLEYDRQEHPFLSAPAIELLASCLLLPPCIPAGRHIGPYEIVSLLGSGGMGDVYRARDAKLARDVAIKILPGVFAEDAGRVARFEREARLLAALNHPHIAAIYGLEDRDGLHGLVLELVEGQTLAARLREGPLPREQAFAIGRQVADALHAAHAKGIVHRDLKPANIAITPDGVVKVLDFGLAKYVGGVVQGEPPSAEAPASASDVSATDGLVGTAAYMSPEQARRATVDERTDVWAFGCVLWAMLTGRAPVAADTVPETNAVVLHREPDWHGLPSGTPVGIVELLRRCLEHDPQHRLRDIAEARTGLDRALGASSSARPSYRSGGRRRTMTVAAAGALVLAAAGALWSRAPSAGPPVARSAWVAVTNFPDPVSQPALSPDGRMMTFVRGPGTFLTPGQVYVKMLPDGEPRQLTNDSHLKMSPVFSPDGSRIVYTTGDAHANWNTWSVPVLGGHPQLWLRNASGLAWLEPHRLVYSEVIGTVHGNHMKLVVADEDHTGSRDLYVPAPNGAMAHRSYPSPDGRWVLTAEMTDRGVWLPCRLIPSDGSSPGRQVGPRGAACRSAAWSPDGRWMYLSSHAGGAYHLWRQRLVAGGTLPAPEPITSGPTEEEGIAMAADGRSLVTAVGLQQSALWVRDAHGARQISLEGYAYMPRFTPDGRHLLYLVSTSATAETSELWMASLSSGRAEPLLPGLPIGARTVGHAGIRKYDLSPDGRYVVVDARDGEGKSRIWLAPVDGTSPPRQLVDLKANTARFGSDGRILFRAEEGAYGFAYAVDVDGTGLTKLAEHPVIGIIAVSPDGRWLVAYLRPTEQDTGVTVAIPLEGGPPVRIAGVPLPLAWSRDGRYVSMSMPSGRTDVVPVPPGQILPDVPADGFTSDAEIAALPGVEVLDHEDVAFGPAPGVYAFSRESVQRNLYRIPTP